MNASTTLTPIVPASPHTFRYGQAICPGPRAVLTKFSYSSAAHRGSTRPAILAVTWSSVGRGRVEVKASRRRLESQRGDADEEDLEEEGEGKGEGHSALIGSMGDLLNLEKQFSFYGAYHSNKFNVLIHMFFVWPIFFTNGILWAYTPAIIPLPLPGGTVPLQQYMVLNVNFLIAGMYALYYAALDRKAGSLGAAICLGCWIGSQAVAQALPWSTAWKVVLLSQIVCWTFQILGHGIFEGRAPALLDNLPQAFLMAPFFVLLEFLQTFLGYEPYPGFRNSVEAKSQAAIADWKASQGKSKKVA